MGHVLARLNGFGIALMPHWPYSFERAAGDAVQVTRWTQSGRSQVVIDPAQPGDGGDVADIAEGKEVGHWLIETSIFRTRWPAGFTVASPQDPSDGTPFYLQGLGEAAIFPQGPVPVERLAGPDALVAPGQTVVDRRRFDDGVAFVEVTYEHDGALWWQSHWTVPFGAGQLMVITAQSLQSAAPQTREAAGTVVAALEPTPR